MKEKYLSPAIVSGNAMEGKNSIFPLGFAAGIAVGMAMANGFKANPISRLPSLQNNLKKSV